MNTLLILKIMNEALKFILLVIAILKALAS